MPKKKSKKLFYEYFQDWIELYKEGAVASVTLDKYLSSQKWVRRLIPTVTVEGLDKQTYQVLLNGYAKHHQRQTVIDFHHQVKGCVLDAFDEGLIPHNPTRRVTIKGLAPLKKRNKYLSKYEVQKLIKVMDLGDELNWDWFLLLILKTGLRFAEALAITPEDFDFKTQMLRINKSFDYKSGTPHFKKTKNASSVRSIKVDYQIAFKFSQFVAGLPVDEPIFINEKRIFNSTVNNRLKVLCKEAGITNISVHGLRHTHASLLIFGGVSVSSVARRLGHANITTTQETYIHIIKELEAKDNDQIMEQMNQLV